MSRRRPRVITLVMTLAVLAAAGGSAVGPASATTSVDTLSEPAFVVDLQSDGDATVSLVVSYDLADDADQQAFDQLREDPSNLTGNFEQRLSRIADRTATDTGREMTISGVSASVETRDGVGVIRVSAEWSNLASVSGDELTLTEPFASEFQPDRLFVIKPPEGYQLATSSHEPANTDAETVQWTSGVDLSGFSTTFATDSSESLPTPLTTLLALGLVSALGYAGHHRLRQKQ
ncbi:DUF7345 domain-containing protein [Halohasta salina]|uniref:DUF7345 domain-containing protein n=1 Tax=Halohasta salina TaxID=2961621 RepID=UPI0020A32B81|nr:hypothetical protein [Halohasta salina]